MPQQYIIINTQLGLKLSSAKVIISYNAIYSDLEIACKMYM